MGPLPEELAVGIENLNAIILAVAYIDILVGIDANRMGSVELSRPCAALAPFQQELALARELDHAGVAVAVGDEEIAVGQKGDVSGTVERVVGRARLSLSAKTTHQFAVRGELKDLVEPGIGGPHVAIVVHAQSVNDAEYTLAEGAEELPLGVEDHDGVGPGTALAGVHRAIRGHGDSRQAAIPPAIGQGVGFLSEQDLDPVLEQATLVRIPALWRLRRTDRDEKDGDSDREKPMRPFHGVEFLL